jgi:hypothetical protein
MFADDDEMESIPSNVEILQSIQDEVKSHNELNWVIDLFKPHIYRWHDLSIEEKSELMFTAGWAVIFRYLTNDRTIDNIVTQKINESRVFAPRFEPCAKITEAMFLPVGLVDYFFIDNEIHKRDCNMRGFGCTCFGFTATSEHEGLC